MQIKKYFCLSINFWTKRIKDEDFLNVFVYCKYNLMSLELVVLFVATSLFYIYFYAKILLKNLEEDKKCVKLVHLVIFRIFMESFFYTYFL